MKAERIKGGWRVAIGEAGGAVEVVGPKVDRGQVRAALTVKIGNVIRHRDTINLRGYVLDSSSPHR